MKKPSNLGFEKRLGNKGKTQLFMLEKKEESWGSIKGGYFITVFRKIFGYLTFATEIFTLSSDEFMQDGKWGKCNK